MFVLPCLLYDDKPANVPPAPPLRPRVTYSGKDYATNMKKAQSEDPQAHSNMKNAKRKRNQKINADAQEPVLEDVRLSTDDTTMDIDINHRRMCKTCCSSVNLYSLTAMQFSRDTGIAAMHIFVQQQQKHIQCSH
ncbi:hypothetical protein DPMN_164909 [Dreissena polymorpha]|uniref:Uncharacterized protein n=1 Tax=Dreissena polymorpha TaxID=45954 RepID=A0A9D4IWI2_DREPO|nr:hypothetical protein DPMN_164909 [Dreissena polymorpha]